MQNHYGFSDETYKGLLKEKITDLDLFKMIKLFDPNESGACLKSKVCVMYYLDKKGDFNAPPTGLKHKKVAKALFHSLDIKADEKLQILGYLEDEDE